MRYLLFPIVGTLLFCSPVDGGTPEDAWWHYVDTIESTDMLDTLQCFSEAMLGRIGDNRSSHGRRKLQRHRKLMYSMLVHDYSYEVVDSRVDGEHATLTLEFTSDKDPESSFTSQVELVREDGLGWMIDNVPAEPSTFDMRLLIGGIVAGLIAFVVVCKKIMP